MGNTTVQWADKTYNFLVGCSKTSEGCRNCYASTGASTGRLQQFPQYQGIANHGNWTGEVRFVPEVLKQILKLKKPQRIFAPSMSDAFHPAVKDEWLDQIFATIALCPQHTFMMLTKRPERMRDYLRSAKQKIRRTAVEIGRQNNLSTTEAFETCQFDWPLPNCWLGVSVENQETADERIPLLLQTPAAVKFLSCEPLLGEINLGIASKPVMHSRDRYGDIAVIGKWKPLWNSKLQVVKPPIDWVICGGESGPKARLCNIDWIRSIIQQCKAAGVPVFCKQVGGVLAKELASSDPKGGKMQDWPFDIQIRAHPAP